MKGIGYLYYLKIRRTIRIISKKKWTIDYRQAHIPPVILLEEGEVIKLRGKISSSDHFQADEVRRWGGSRRFEKRQKNKSD